MIIGHSRCERLVIFMRLEVGKLIAASTLFASGIGCFFLGLRLGGFWLLAGFSGIWLCAALIFDTQFKFLKRREKARTK